MPRFKCLAEIIRLNPHLSHDNPLQLPMKVRGLLEDEYKFFRGTADLFYDFCRTACRDWADDPTTRVSLHGDLHLGNLGTYRAVGDQDVALSFAVVDLDETVSGDFRLDLLRALTSLRAMAGAHVVQMSDKQWREVAGLLVTGYRDGLSVTEPRSPYSRHKPVKKLLDKAKDGSAKEYLARYVSTGPLRRFLPLRLKDGRPADLMRPVTLERRQELIDALWMGLSPGTNRILPARLRFLSRADLQQAVLDVVEWTRLDSSGSQGLHKYLVLLDRSATQQLSAGGPDADLVIIQLKEQPCPAATRVGLLAAEPGPSRAEEVADAYRRLVEPDRWLVSSLAMGNRGFVVLAKDAWGEEFSGKPFASLDGLRDAARILGEAAGRAHRDGVTFSSNGQQRLESLLATADERLAEVLCTRSEEAAEYLRRLFLELRADPKARALAEKADRAIQEAARGAKGASRAP